LILEKNTPAAGAWAGASCADFDDHVAGDRGDSASRLDPIEALRYE